MVNSATWTDRNKGAWVLFNLTASRDARVLDQIKRGAIEGLTEMAKWRDVGHAYQARIVLGRIAGIPEERLQQLASGNSVDGILNALNPR
jgi:hypothetical protein